MDRLINNESIAVCSVLDALNLNINPISKLYLYVVMSSDHAIRERLDHYDQYDVFIQKESSFYQALNRKFVDFQPVFLNAMTMLLLGGKIEKEPNNGYVLTIDGIKMLMDLQKKGNGVVSDIAEAVNKLNSLLCSKNVITLYNDLRIVL